MVHSKWLSFQYNSSSKCEIVGVGSREGIVVRALASCHCDPEIKPKSMIVIADV